MMINKGKNIFIFNKIVIKILAKLIDNKVKNITKNRKVI